jgi:di/tricarboxylate transporter
MNADLIIVLVLLGAAILMFGLGRPRVDAVALVMLVALPFTGVVSVEESLAGFANPNVVLIAAMFVIGEALAATGVARAIGDWLMTRGVESEWGLLALLMLAVGLLGSVMSSTGVVAIFIPVVLRIASRSRIAPGRLMMPMAYAALISGMMTLVATSPNLVINYEVVRSGAEGFNFFDFTPFGVPILLVGILYMLVARRWLPAQAPLQGAGMVRPRLRDLVERYRLAEREHRVRVMPGSKLLGSPLAELARHNTTGVEVLLIERGEGRARRLLARAPNIYLQPGDVLLVDMDRPGEDIEALAEEYGVEVLPRSGSYFMDRTQQVGLVEVMLPYESQFVGKTAVDAERLAHSELTLVGLRRGREALEPSNLRERVLKPGDTLLLAGSWRSIGSIQSLSQDLVVLNLPREHDDVLPAGHKSPYAVFTLAVVIVLMATGLVSNVQAALIGCLMMGLFGCINLEQAYRAIQWKGLIMIVGMLPFALALDRTGGVDLAANALLGVVGDAGPYAVLALLYLVTVVLGLFIVNTANAVLLIPVALTVAEAMQASPYPFAMIIALGASAAFMTPISPINTLVTTAGNYSFGDFIRIGLPLTIIVGLVSVLLVPMLLPLW